ncbi:hypothetical protein [Streptomyces sp. CC228A]|uniref:hypothetical protein n=1 Tax=Streptomyces sp. CC228A TaxID=2898186 RepID=UPI001F3EB54B|nr:hypothetical protein [Streptomyces sp. CC228A]
MDEHVTLFSSSLLSKWGFNDGDEPEAWLNWCDTHGIDYTRLDYPLAALVREHLLPVIEQPVTAVDIETCHNPIRIDTLHGVDVTNYWRDTSVEGLLTPEKVDVPMTEVLRLALAEAGLTEAPRYEGPLAHS